MHPEYVHLKAAMGSEASQKERKTETIERKVLLL